MAVLIMTRLVIRIICKYKYYKIVNEMIHYLSELIPDELFTEEDLSDEFLIKICNELTESGLSFLTKKIDESKLVSNYVNSKDGEEFDLPFVVSFTVKTIVANCVAVGRVLAKKQTIQQSDEDSTVLVVKDRDKE